jgi:hypothetical protein
VKKIYHRSAGNNRIQKQNNKALFQNSLTTINSSNESCQGQEWLLNSRAAAAADGITSKEAIGDICGRNFTEWILSLTSAMQSRVTLKTCMKILKKMLLQ